MMKWRHFKMMNTEVIWPIRRRRRGEERERDTIRYSKSEWLLELQSSLSLSSSFVALKGKEDADKCKMPEIKFNPSPNTSTTKTMLQSTHMPILNNPNLMYKWVAPMFNLSQFSQSEAEFTTVSSDRQGKLRIQWRLRSNSTRLRFWSWSRWKSKSMKLKDSRNGNFKDSPSIPLKALNPISQSTNTEVSL